MPPADAAPAVPPTGASLEALARAGEPARLLEVIRRAPSFVAVLRGPAHRLELANDACLQLVGHAADAVGRPLPALVADAAPPALAALLDGVLATGEPYEGRELPVRLERVPGAAREERLVDLWLVPLLDEDGMRAGVVLHATDVTEHVHGRRETERARDRAERLQELTAALAAARTLEEVANVVVSDMVVALGARTGALAGRAPEGGALVLLRTVGFPARVQAGVQRQTFDLRSPLIDCYLSRAPLWIERREGPDGLDARYPMIAPVWDVLRVRAAAFVPLVVAGEAVGAISFAFAAARTFTPGERDFLQALGGQAALAMERARLFDAEHAARAEAEAANRAKGEFLAVMSHELRTPLNAIGGYAELMEMGIHGAVTPQQAEDLRRIQTSQRHLLGLINQVLNYTRIDAGAVQYDIESVPVGEALAAAEALIVPQVRARGLTYVLGVVDTRLAVRADREKLQQVLLNLLGNAVKFTEPGGQLRVEVADDERWVRLTVRDTGIGIAPEKLLTIFEPFVQVDARLTRRQEGVGLGLAISRDLARGMGGELTAASTPGRGSAFTLALPRG